MEDPMKRCRKREGGIALTDDMKGSGDEGDRDEIEAESIDVGIRVYEDGDWAGGVVVASAGCQSGAYAVESLVNDVL